MKSWSGGSGGRWSGQPAANPAAMRAYSVAGSESGSSSASGLRSKAETPLPPQKQRAPGKLPARNVAVKSDSASRRHLPIIDLTLEEGGEEDEEIGPLPRAKEQTAPPKVAASSSKTNVSAPKSLPPPKEPKTFPVTPASEAGLARKPTVEYRVQSGGPDPFVKPPPKAKPHADLPPPPPIQPPSRPAPSVVPSKTSLASSTTGPSMVKSGAKDEKDRRDVLLDTVRKNGEKVREILGKYLQEMKEDHVYAATQALGAARLDNSQIRVFKGPGTGRPGIRYDDESPFKNMKSIALDISVADAQKRTNIGKFVSKTFTKPSAPSEQKLFLPRKVVETPENLALVPKYHSYTTLRKNVLAEDDENMHYHPYFGENAQDDEVRQLHLEDTFVDKTKAAEVEGRNQEFARMYGYFIEDFLKECGISVEAVARYLTGHIQNIRGGQSRVAITETYKLRKQALPPDFDLHDSKWRNLNARIGTVDVADLELAEIICRAFKDVTKISIWEPIKNIDAVKGSIAQVRLTTGSGMQASQGNLTNHTHAEKENAAMSGGNPNPYTLESYASLCCLICFMHECPFHGRHYSPGPSDSASQASLSSENENLSESVQKDQDKLAMSREAGDESDKQSRSSKKKDNTVIMHLATNIPGWSSSSKTALEDPWKGKNTPCENKCILKAKGSMEDVQASQWTAADEAMLETSASVLKNNPRCSCLITAAIDKTCTEIYHRLAQKGLLPDNEPAPQEDTPEPPVISGPKRKKGPFGVLPGYPADCHHTSLHHLRQSFQACRHLGHCTETCPCVQMYVTCEKSCTCTESCPRRWRGCNCRREERPCADSNCACIQANRECDPDLCGPCDAAIALDPVTRYDADIIAKRCQNVALQRDMPVRTLLGRSSVAGFGLFVGVPVKKQGFIGEYKGEVITTEEAERRGKLYDKRGVSFLFNLNASQVIDATRAGNKLRSINHSAKNPNVGAKIYFANCTHRIAMFALRDLLPGEELFFDYGYNNKQVKFVQKEAPDVFPPASRDGSAVPADERPVQRRRKPRDKSLEYLKGGHGTTARTMQLKTAREPDTARVGPSMPGPSGKMASAPSLSTGPSLASASATAEVNGPAVGTSASEPSNAAVRKPAHATKSAHKVQLPAKPRRTDTTTTALSTDDDETSDGSFVVEDEDEMFGSDPDDEVGEFKPDGGSSDGSASEDDSEWEENHNAEDARGVARKRKTSAKVGGASRGGRPAGGRSIKPSAHSRKKMKFSRKGAGT